MSVRLAILGALAAAALLAVVLVLALSDRGEAALGEPLRLKEGPVESTLQGTDAIRVTPGSGLSSPDLRPGESSPRSGAPSSVPVNTITEDTEDEQDAPRGDKDNSGREDTRDRAETDVDDSSAAKEPDRDEPDTDDDRTEADVDDSSEDKEPDRDEPDTDDDRRDSSGPGRGGGDDRDDPDRDDD